MESKSGKVILVRHAKTELNNPDEERVRAWLDIPLDEQGRREAGEIGLALSDYPITRVISSPLQRAYDTAVAIAKVQKLPPPLRTQSLLPWNVGDLSGQPVKKVLNLMKALADDGKSDQPAPNGESFNSFKERFLSFLLPQVVAVGKSGEVVCLVTHSRDAQVAKAWVAAGCQPDRSYDPDVMNDYDNELPTGKPLIIDPSCKVEKKV